MTFVSIYPDTLFKLWLQIHIHSYMQRLKYNISKHLYTYWVKRDGPQPDIS